MADECCGATPSSAAESVAEAPARFWQIRSVQLSILAGAWLAIGLVAGTVDAEVVATFAFAGAVIVGGSTFVPEALRDLVRRRLGVGLLMTVAAVGAVILGDWGEAASLAFLFSISEALESYAMARTRRGLRALLDLVPARVSVERHGGEELVAAGEVVVGDRIVLHPGERLATDGIVVNGRSALDVSAVTGESLPVECEPGTDVYAGSVNGGGVLVIEASAAVDDSSLARVVAVVEEAQQHKGQAQRMAERVARPLVPAVIVTATAIAVIGSIWGDPTTWVHRALVVLVAAAPCALAISVPVTVVAAIGASTRNGVLIKGGRALEALARVRVVAFDKTGTLTRNQPAVIEVVAVPGLDQGNLWAVAAGLEARSEHPLAAAILHAAPTIADATDVTAVAGHGVTGLIDGRPARLGKPGFIPTDALDADVDRLRRSGATVVAVELDGALLGILAVRDELRPEATAVVSGLRQVGVRHVAVLTGDHRATAEAVARPAGVDEIDAELLPDDKVRAVQALQERGPVAMIGDGINDAPALATADVGIAMGAFGTDVAIEAADVVVMADTLTPLPTAIGHARRSGRIMAQNLALSAVILIALVPLAATGMLGLAAVVATHELAELIVIANGLRASRRKVPVAETSAGAHLSPVQLVPRPGRTP